MGRDRDRGRIPDVTAEAGDQTVDVAWRERERESRCGVGQVVLQPIIVERVWYMWMSDIFHVSLPD